MQGGISYIKKENHAKIEKIFNIITFTYVGCYFVT